LQVHVAGHAFKGVMIECGVCMHRHHRC
jgi:hypothetical protein